MPRSTEQPGVASPATRPPSLVSDRLRKAISEKMLADTKLFATPMASPTPRSESAAHPDDAAVLMDRVVVKTDSLRVAKLAPVDPPLLRFLKTGTLYKGLHGNVEVEIYLRIMTAGEKAGLARGREFTRTELAFSFSW